MSPALIDFIKSLHVLHISGLEVYTFFKEEESPITEDSAGLVSGFLAAIFSFASTVYEDSVQSMQFENRTCFYDMREELIFVVTVKPDIDDRPIRRALKSFINSFWKDFGLIIMDDPRRLSFDNELVTAIYSKCPELINTDLPPVLEDEDAFTGNDIKEGTPGSIKYLLNMFPNELDRVMNALLTGIMVGVVGVEFIVNSCVSALKSFAPYRALNIGDYSNEVNDFDLQPLSPEANPQASDKFVIIDLQKPSIAGGRKCQFCQEILIQIKVAKERPELIVANAIRNVYVRALALKRMSEKNLLSSPAFRPSIKGMNPSFREIVIQVVQKFGQTEADNIRKAVLD